MKLKYHDSGKDREVAPGVGQWNMIDKVSILTVVLFILFAEVVKVLTFQFGFVENVYWCYCESLGMPEFLKPGSRFSAIFLPGSGCHVR